VIVAHTMSFSLSTTQKLGCTRVRAQRAPVKRNAVKRAVVPRAASASADVPDMTKRSVMNLLLVGAIGLPATSLIGGYAYFFVPPRCAQRRARVAIVTSAIAIRSREMHNVRVRDIYPHRDTRAPRIALTTPTPPRASGGAEGKHTRYDRTRCRHGRRGRRVETLRSRVAANDRAERAIRNGRDAVLGWDWVEQ